MKKRKKKRGFPIGLVLKRMRERLGANQYDFSELLGVSQPNLSKLEQGIHVSDMRVLARAFRVGKSLDPKGVEELLGWLEAGPLDFNTKPAPKADPRQMDWIEEVQSA